MKPASQSLVMSSLVAAIVSAGVSVLITHTKDQAVYAERARAAEIADRYAPGTPTAEKIRSGTSY